MSATYCIFTNILSCWFHPLLPLQLNRLFICPLPCQLTQNILETWKWKKERFMGSYPWTKNYRHLLTAWRRIILPKAWVPIWLTNAECSVLKPYTNNQPQNQQVLFICIIHTHTHTHAKYSQRKRGYQLKSGDITIVVWERNVKRISGKDWREVRGAM